MTDQTLTEILTAMSRMGINIDREMNSELVEEVCRRYNDTLKFAPESQSENFTFLLKLICINISSDGIQYSGSSIQCNLSQNTHQRIYQENSAQGSNNLK